MHTHKDKIIAIIPARYQSSRFPGKPLHEIAGKSLIQRTFENSLKCDKLDSIIIATDDERILKHVKTFSNNVVMTAIDCLNGTERVLEAINKTSNNIDKDCIIINIQGDEPSVSPETIRDIIEALENSDAYMSTGISILEKKEDIENPSIVKCVINKNNEALYFSRAAIPHPHKSNNKHTYYKHIGIYAYRYHFLKSYLTLKNSDLQLTEDLEQLKVLEHGYKIKIAIVTDDSIGVDTPADAQKLEEILCQQNSFS